MAITAPDVWLDGKIVDNDAATAPLMSHAIQRGSLVFDVGSFHHAGENVVLFRAREHVARLLRSARIVGLDVRVDEETLIRAACLVVAKSGATSGLVRWSAFFAASEPDLLPRASEARVVVAAQTYADPPRVAPMRVAVFEDARKAAPDVLSPHAKAAAAYLGPMLARRRAIEAGADEVVLLDRDGRIAEAPTANVFAVKGGVLWTPPLTHVLAGITRDAVLTIAAEEGIAVREEAPSLDAFVSAEEAFLTATSFPIAPIGAVNGRPIAGAPGPITKRLTSRLEDAQLGRDARRASWLTPTAESPSPRSR